MLGPLMTMRAVRSSTMAIGLAVALLGAGCGGQDGASDGAAVSALDATTSAPSTTLVPSTTVTTATSTTPPPTSAALPTPTAPPTTGLPTSVAVPPTTAAAAPAAPDYCEGAGPLPSSAVLDTSLVLDLMGDGSADDLIEAYDVDGWSRLRLTTGGSVVSEIINPAIDGRYRPLGVAPVFPGDSAELFAVIGDGSVATEIGVFGVDADDCVFSYTSADTSEDFTTLIRPASPFRSGAVCFDGGIGVYTAEQRSDGKWDASSSAFEIATPATLQYLGGSDDYSEGLEESELPVFEFDCFGLSL